MTAMHLMIVNAKTLSSNAPTKFVKKVTEKKPVQVSQWRARMWELCQVFDLSCKTWQEKSFDDQHIKFDMFSEATVTFVAGVNGKVVPMAASTILVEKIQGVLCLTSRRSWLTLKDLPQWKARKPYHVESKLIIADQVIWSILQPVIILNQIDLSEAQEEKISFTLSHFCGPLCQDLSLWILLPCC